MLDLLNHISEKVLSDYDRLRDDAGLIDHGLWSLIELTGDDRKGWLQGQVTNDLRRFENGSSSSFCLCSPTGQLECVADAWALPDRFALTCERAASPAFLHRVGQMVVLEDVFVSDRTKDFKLLSIQGPGATRRLGELLELPSLDAGQTELSEAPVYVFRSNRAGLGGWDLWIPAARRKALETIRSAFPAVDQEAFDVARLEAGVPRFGADYNEKTLASEMGPAFETKHISYTKGCYTGQEVLMRIHSRGHTNRTWVGLLSESPLSIGSSVSHASRKDAGVVTSAGFSPDYGHIGAAMVRNEVADDRETVRVATESGEVEAEVRRMPILRLG